MGEAVLKKGLLENGFKPGSLELSVDTIIMLRVLLITFIIGFVAITSGALMVVVLIYTYKDANKAIKYLAVFLIVFGIWVLQDKGLITLIHRKYIFHVEINIFILILGKVAFLFFIYERYSESNNNRFKVVLKGIVILFLIWVIVSIFPIGNRYQLYNLTVILNFIIIFYGGYLIHLNAFTTKEYKGLQLFSAFVLIEGYIVEVLFYNLLGFYIRGVLVNITILIFLLTQLIVEVLIVNNKLKNRERIKAQLKESKIKLMLRQMEPHFYSNVLIAIQDLCYTEPEKAGDYIALFYSYLRSNMLYLSQEMTISFMEERNLIHKYINLQKLCYGDAIQFSEHIEVEDFNIPPLTVQPFVENAVCHGIRKRRGIGKVKLSTIKLVDKMLIVIEDDGIGFINQREQWKLEDFTEKFSSTKNIIYRIENQYEGKVYIESVEGKGTVVSIELPILPES